MGDDREDPAEKVRYKGQERNVPVQFEVFQKQRQRTRKNRSAAALAACRAALEVKRRQLSAMDTVRDAAQITLEMTEIQKRIRVLEQETAALEEAFHAAENALSAANEAVKAATQQMFAAKEAKNALGAAPEKDLPQSKAELDAKSTETQTLSVQLGRFDSDLRTIAAIHGGSRRARRTVQPRSKACGVRDRPQQRLARTAFAVRARHDARRDHPERKPLFLRFKPRALRLAAQAGQKRRGLRRA